MIYPIFNKTCKDLIKNSYKGKSKKIKNETIKTL